MPDKPITKRKLCISIDIGLLAVIKQKARENNMKVSQQFEHDLMRMYDSSKRYMEYELKRQMEILEVLKFRISKRNAEIEAEEVIHGIKRRG